MKKSIEIGHIYQDMELNNNYIELLKKSISLIKEDRDDYNLKILIDDLNIKDIKWKVEDFFAFLKSHKIDIDNIAYESKFSNMGSVVESCLDKDKLIVEIKEEEINYYIKNGNKKVKIKTIKNNETQYSCTFLSACWQLCRLGIFDYPEGAIKTLNRKSGEEKYIVNIIEKKYKKVEENVLIILKEFNLENNVRNILI